MRKINYLFAMAVLGFAATLAGCIKAGEGGGHTPEKPTVGVVDMSTVEVLMEDASEQSTEEFEVVITNASNVVVANGKLGELSSLNLPAGDYTIAVSSLSEAPLAEWDTPFYVANGTFSIEGGATTSVGALTAQLRNIGVEVVFTEKFREKAGNDCKVEVVLGLGSLTYTLDENRMGYFCATSDKMLLTAELTGTVDGKPVKEQRVIRDVKPGDRKQVTYDIKEEPVLPPVTPPEDDPIEPPVVDPDPEPEPDPEPVDPPVDEPEEGDVDVNFSVDVTVKDVDIDGNIIVDENDDEIEGDDDGNGDGNGDGEGEGEGEGEGDEPGPVTPPSDGPEDLGEPTIVWEGHDLDEWFELVDASTKVALNITAPNKIKTLVVDIISNAEAFQPDQLQGVGLDTRLDLSNPGEMREVIESLGFPTSDRVVGLTELLFDISDFMAMMIVAEDKNVEFRLTLTDEFGHEISKSLKMKVNLN